MNSNPLKLASFSIPAATLVDEWELERQEFLRLPRLPAMLTDLEAGWLLGFTAEAIGVLVLAGALPALGAAGPDDRKRFACVQLMQLRGDRAWLDQATNLIYQSRRKTKPAAEG